MINEKDIREMVSEILEMKPEDIPEWASFVQDLGMDSLRALEILAGLEKKYTIVIPPERLADMQSLRGVIDVATEIYRETYANDDI